MDVRVGRSDLGARIAMSVAGEASSSQAPAPSSPPPSPQADRANVAHQAPPETMCKQRIKWSWASYTGEHGAQSVRLFSWDSNGNSRVKGDDSEEPPESDSQWGARIDEQAHQTGLQDDLLRYDNDVVREQVVAATDAFIEDSLLVSEEEERDLLEGVLGTKGKFGESCKRLAKVGAVAAAAAAEADIAVKAGAGPQMVAFLQVNFDRGGKRCACA